MKIKELINESYVISRSGKNIEDVTWKKTGGDLTGAPQYIRGDFDCWECDLDSMNGGPHTVNNYDCSDNNITTFDGAPRDVENILNLSHNKIRSLVGIEEKIDRIGNRIILDYNPIEEGGVGLLLIDDLKHVEVSRIDKSYPAMMIINLYLEIHNHSNLIYDCQKELIDAGFEAYARL